MCGEHRNLCGEVDPLEGSSPHVRGARAPSHDRYDATGIIPACAGSTVHEGLKRVEPRDHPRMCGEHVAMTGW